MHNQELEQSLIGSLIANGGATADILLEVLTVEDFYFAEHQKIWKHIQKSNSINKGENKITLKDFVKQVAGDEYLSVLLRAASGLSVFIRDNALELKDLTAKRLIIQSAQEAINKCGSGELSTQEIKEELERSLASLENQKEGKTERSYQAMMRVAQSSTAAHDGTNSIITTKTRFSELDKLTGGFRPSELIVLAARPAMGKSALAANIAVNAAKGGKTVLFFSFEMSNNQISTRILANETSISLNKIKNGFASFEERKTLENKAEDHKQIPLIIQDTAGVNINSLRARIKKVAKNTELGLVVVDYLQQIQGTRKNNRVEEVSEITRALKEMAIEFDVPILALSQLSRAVELRENKRPQLADLRESGSIEQDANIVMFIYRDEYYLKEKSQSKGLAEVIIAKQRDGEIGNFFLKFEPSFSRFINHF